MKRRGFLQLLGSAMSAPLMPPVPLGAAASGAAGAAYPASAMAAALAQAKSRVVFSVFPFAQEMGLGLDQAEALLTDLSRKGVIGPLQGTTQAGRWASSRVWQHPAPSALAAPGAATHSKIRRGAQPARNLDPKGGGATGAADKKEQNMQKFETITGVAAPMPLVNIDTDMIIPKRFLKSIKRTGFGVSLFDEMRYNRDGSEVEGFVLNKPQYRNAEILVAGDNFGCGSSREHAPWAILDFGIRCVIAPSFADIFFNNCFKNGILPIPLPQETVDILMADAEKGENARMTVDLVAQEITTSDGQVFSFEVDPFKKKCLMEGLDDIGLTMAHEASIDAFEAKHSAAQPWV